MTPAPKASTTGGQRQVVVVDDHPLLRRGLSDLLDRADDLELCGEASNASEAAELFEHVHPALAVVDLSMPGGDGLELVARLTALHSATAILVLSMHDEALYAEQVLKAGARGYVMKHEPPQEVLRAIRRVLDGHIYLSAAMTERVLERSAVTQVGAAPAATLTSRELQVLRLMGEGRGTGQIADALCLSTKTIDTHRANLKRKLGLKTHTELMRYAIRWTDDASM